MDNSEDEGYLYRCRDMFESDSGRGVVLRAASDHAVTHDPRALHHLTAVEKSFRVSSYFDGVQMDIQPCMRRILAVWMLEVC